MIMIIFSAYYIHIKMINVSKSHIDIKQWWWSMCLYLIFISSNDDDECVCISVPYQAMMMSMINVSICHVSSFLFYYVNFLALNPKIFIIFGSLSSSRKIGSFFNLPLNIERDDHLKGDVRDIFISSCLCLIFLFCYHNHHQQVFVM